VSLAELRGDVVILACAVSAGIHGALVPGHFDEGTGAGLGFAAATVVLAALVVWLTRRPASVFAFTAAATALAGLLVSYVLATTTGLPVLHPDPEPVDALALATKAIEAVGLLAASSLLWRPRVALRVPQPKGTLT
jgi:drug/metabolite transporter (DMT)-like permease